MLYIFSKEIHNLKLTSYMKGYIFNNLLIQNFRNIFYICLVTFYQNNLQASSVTVNFNSFKNGYNIYNKFYNNISNNHTSFNCKKEISGKKTLLDYGRVGHLFRIQEESLLDYIQSKLRQAKKLDNLVEKFQNNVKNKISNPNKITGIQNTTQERVIYYDPSYTQKHDIKDKTGKIIIKKNTKINPLKYISWGKALIFIDAQEKNQLNWAVKQDCKIILVNGKPLELFKKFNRWFYYDQSGILVKKFQINQVPAIIKQEGLKLKITEFKL